MRVSRETLAELIHALGAWETGGIPMLPDDRPWGNTVTLRGTGSTAVPQAIDEQLVERRACLPRQWTIVTSAEMQGTIAAETTVPAAVVKVRATVASVSLDYELDAGSNRLTVWGHTVRVTAAWDSANLSVPQLLPRTFPTLQVVQAALYEPVSVAVGKRSIYIPNTAAATVQSIAVPFGASGVMIRQGGAAVPGTYAATVGAIRWRAASNGGAFDLVEAADVVAAHGAGRYLPVPPGARMLDVSVLATPALTNLLAEFEIRP